MRQCSFDGCERPNKAKSYCKKHYDFYKRHGSLKKYRPRRRKGEGCIRGDGYKVIFINGHEILEHRHIYEKHHNVTLKRRQIIHHKDGNRSNNSIDNLELLESQSDHIKHHNTERILIKSKLRGEHEGQKYCTCCKIVLNLSDFYKNPHHRLGYSQYCKQCTKKFYPKEKK